MQRYGVNTLRTRVALCSANNTSEQEESSRFISKLKGMLKGFSKSTNTRSSNTMRSQKRAVLHMAIGYAAAWLLVYGTYSLSNNYLSGPLFFVWLYTYPLQGFLNLLVFIAPKVRDTRKISRMRGRDLTWCQAFRKAYMARGPARPNSRALTRR